MAEAARVKREEEFHESGAKLYLRVVVGLRALHQFGGLTNWLGRRYRLPCERNCYVELEKVLLGN